MQDALKQIFESEIDPYDFNLIIATPMVIRGPDGGRRVFCYCAQYKGQNIKDQIGVLDKDGLSDLPHIFEAKDFDKLPVFQNTLLSRAQRYMLAQDIDEEQNLDDISMIMGEYMINPDIKSDAVKMITKIKALIDHFSASQSEKLFSKSRAALKEAMTRIATLLKAQKKMAPQSTKETAEKTTINIGAGNLSYIDMKEKNS